MCSSSYEASPHKLKACRKTTYFQKLLRELSVCAESADDADRIGAADPLQSEAHHALADALGATAFRGTRGTAAADRFTTAEEEMIEDKRLKIED